jgi:hypothetical protein
MSANSSDPLTSGQTSATSARSFHRRAAHALVRALPHLIAYKGKVYDVTASVPRVKV